MFEIYGGTTELTQWTKNQKLIMDRLPIGAEVFFYNDPNDDEPLVTEVYEYKDENGKSFKVCDVPNTFLTETKRIKVRIPNRVVGLYGVVHSYVGQREKSFDVEPAEKPSDYVYEKTVVKGVLDKNNLPDGYPWKDEWQCVLFDNQSVAFFVEDSATPYLGSIAFQKTVDLSKNVLLTVTFDGETYECVPIAVMDSFIFGNTGLVGFGSDTGEPFMAQTDGSTATFITLLTDSEHEISVSAYGIEIEPLSSQYLSENVVQVHSITEETGLPESIVWDGDTTDRASLTFNAENYYKISDEVPSYDALIGSVITISGGNGDENISSNMIEFGDKGNLARRIFVAYETGLCTLEANGGRTYKFEIPETGIYSIKSATYIERIRLSQTITRKGIVIPSGSHFSKKKFFLYVDDTGSVKVTEVA